MTTPQAKLRIATRASALALQQARHVQSLLEKLSFKVTIVTCTTKGDQLRDVPLHDFGGKGLFVREVENALLQKQAEIAVHSLKDMPVNDIHPELVFACFLPRQTAGDVLLLHKKNDSLPKLLDKKTITSMQTMQIATGSLRRKYLLLHANPNLQVQAVRGNVDTRLRALRTGKYQALVLAQVALQRLGIKTQYTHVFDKSWYVPSCGQGVLAVQTRADSPHLSALAELACPQTTACVQRERAIIKALGGNCALPFGCHAYQQDMHLHIDAVAMSTKHLSRVSVNVPPTMEVADVVAKVMTEFAAAKINLVLQDL